MHLSIAQLKQSAKQNLLGRYKSIIFALVLSELITVLLNTPFSNMTDEGTAYGILSRVLLGYAGSLIVSLLAFLLQAGIFYMHLQIAGGEKPRIRQLFFAFTNRPDRYIGFGALMILVSFLCLLVGILFTVFFSLIGAILFLVIGCIVMIVIALSWSMTVFLLLEDDELPVLTALRQSRQMMRGNKGRLFLLYLSFIGWFLFSILTLFIGLLWIIPYMGQSITCFYLDLKANYQATE